MPHVAERIEAGHLRSMRASLPEISSVSWSSFMTGTGPGEHGIFGFTDIDPQSYALRFPGFSDVGAPTFWDRLGKSGLRSVVLNQPSTYPARTIPGVLVSGFVAIDLVKAVKPLRHLGPLRRLGYRIDIDTRRARADHDHLISDLDRTLKARAKAVDYLWEVEDWDYFQLVITGTDRLYHYLWDALEDPSHQHHQAALDYHCQVDKLVGRIFERFDAGQNGGAAGFYMLSDHGFCGIVREVQLNAWLRDEGYFGLENEGGEGLERIDPGSRAFVLDPGRIYIHRKGRFARGGVEEQDVEVLKAEIAGKLLQLEWEGKRVIREVFDAGEIYQGPRVAYGPDLVALSTPGFDLKGSPKAKEIFARTDLVGMHTWDDAFLITPAPVEGEELWIGDIATLLTEELGK